MSTGYESDDGTVLTLRGGAINISFKVEDGLFVVTATRPAARFPDVTLTAYLTTDQRTWLKDWLSRQPVTPASD